MATETDPRETSTDAGWKPYRLTNRQVLAMVDAGIFRPTDRCELLGGILVQTMTKGDPLDYTSGELGGVLRLLMPDPWLIREVKSLQIGLHSRLEPDLAVVLGPGKQYRRRTPTPEETALIVEVSDSTYAYDRGEKWRAYAAARVPIYWIVNIARMRVEVYRDLDGRGKSAAYRESTTYGPDDQLPVILGVQEVGRIAIREILP